jgi:hypothetical protein
LGHLTSVPFDDSFVIHAHPEQNKDNKVNAQKIIPHFRIGIHASFYSIHSFPLCMKSIDHSTVLKNDVNFFSFNAGLISIEIPD